MAAGSVTRRTLMIAAILSILAGMGTVQAGTVYVTPQGNDVYNDGLTWATAKGTVGGAIDVTAPGDEVWVKAGTYVERITLKNEVAVYGGFAGNETALTQRDWAANVTILDGDYKGPVVYAQVGATPATRVDGFTIRNGGNAPSSAPYTRWGGGVYSLQSSPTIANNIITANRVSEAGGGIYCTGTSSVISNNTITGNYAGYAGGGIYCAGSSATVLNNKVTANSAGSNGMGGGIYTASATVSNNAVTGNTAGVDGRGAGVYLTSGTLSYNIITENAAKGMGGGICEFGTSASKIFNNIITNNLADSGGGVYCGGSSTVCNNTILGNAAITAGGGSYFSNPNSQFVANIVAFNSSGLAATGTSPVLRKNCVYNLNANYSGLSPGLTDVSVDPQLVAPAFGDFHLKAGSRCFNGGDDSVLPAGAVDMDGEPRIQSRHVDIGADEYNGTTPAFTWKVVRVSPSGDDANDGSTWGLAKKTAQAAIKAAAGTGGEVWVAAGTYAERITLKNYVYVYGGFAGSETSRDQRNWGANVTTLDGGAGGSVVTASGVGYGLSAIDGFTIRNGSAGGIYCSNSSPAITNNIITANTTTAGGCGIYCSYSWSTISKNTITGNVAHNSDGTAIGGGIACDDSAVAIFGNIITRNTADARGGGVSLTSGRPTIASNIISGNVATKDDSVGGGIYCYGSSATIANNTIVGNVVTPRNYDYTPPEPPVCQGGGIYIYGPSSASIVNNIVAFNASGLYGYGGATPILKNNCVFNPGGTDYVGVSAGIGDIVVDPRLVAAEYGEVHLSADSPCINTGDDTLVESGSMDIDGQPRLQAEHVDIGADEFNGMAPSYTTNVVRVSSSGDDANDGLSWAAPKQTVQAAIDAAANGGGGDVWVKGGTYAQPIGLKQWVHVYGGFAGTEGNRDERNWPSNLTTLDGNASGTVVTASFIAPRSSTIDGFTIRHGTASGVYCYNASPVISKNTIAGNSASGTDNSGGGVYCNYSNPEISGNKISGNTAKSCGGAIYCNYSSPTISNNTMTANFAGSMGGGMYFYSGAPRASNNIVAFNSSGLCAAAYSSPIVNNNCVHNPAGTNYSGLNAGIGDLSVDPQLTGAEYGNLHLQAGSPCINAGLDTAVGSGLLDIDGEPRIYGTHVDIGADEFNGSTPAFTPNVVRVSSSGNDANDGSTWVQAKLTVQAGISAAADLAGGEVWVSAGTYHELIALQDWVHVYGGFAGAETTRAERNPAVNVTTLDGAGDGNVVTVVSCAYRSNTIDGFIICNGHTGVYCDQASPVISNNTITGNGVNALNTEGGGICSYYGAPAIFNNTISANDAGVGGGGGGIYCDYSLGAIFENVISNNTASNIGGGICCGNSSPQIMSNTLVGNTALFGGGIYWRTCSPVISNNTVAFNSSGLYGGWTTLRNNCVYNPAGANYSGLSAGASNISVDPLFVNRDAGDYRLASGSPCIDAGYNAAASSIILFDLDGHPRFFEDPATQDCRWSPGSCGTAPIVDMGAYEFIPAIVGDFDHDGDVDVIDLGRFEECSSGPAVEFAEGCANADFDEDLDVDQGDFGAFQRCLREAWMPLDLDCMR